MNEVTKTRPAHLFKKGQSGNPSGRPKGSKNAITSLKLQMEGELRQQIKGRLPGIMAKAAELAEAGDPVMIKWILDAWVSKSRSSDDDTGGREKIQIVIGKLTNDEPPRVVGKLIDGESNEI